MMSRVFFFTYFFFTSICTKCSTVTLLGGWLLVCCIFGTYLLWVLLLNSCTPRMARLNESIIEQCPMTWDTLHQTLYHYKLRKVITYIYLTIYLFDASTSTIPLKTGILYILFPLDIQFFLALNSSQSF